jgi:hypothetical protein
MFIWRIVTEKRLTQSRTRQDAARRPLSRQHNKTDDDDDVIVMRGEHNAKPKQSARQRAPRFASQRLRAERTRTDALRRSQTTQI